MNVVGAVEVVGCYARLSRLKGRDENIETQHMLEVDLANEKFPGCKTVLYADPDASAESEDVYRADYEQIKADLLSGRLTQIVTSDQERLTRRPDELERLITVFRAAGVTGFWGYRDGWTSVAPGQAAGARYKGVGAKEYVEGIKVKVNEKLELLASQGRPGPTRHIAYQKAVDERGRKTLEVIPKRAEMVRWAAKIVDAQGWTLTAVARELQRRRVPTMHGGLWHRSVVKHMLTSPTVAGLRLHKGELIRAIWEPILDEVTWRRLCTKLNAPRTVVRSDGVKQQVARPQRPARKYVLTNILTCDICGISMSGRNQHHRARPGRPQEMYMCLKARGGCGRLAIIARPTEDFVRDEMFEHLDDPDFQAAMAADQYKAQRAQLVEELSSIEVQQIELARRWGQKQLSNAAWDAAREELDVRRLEASTKLAEVPAPMVEFDPEVIKADWGKMTLDEKRHVTRLLLKRVTIMPAKPGTNRFDKNRIVITDDDWNI